MTEAIVRTTKDWVAEIKDLYAQGASDAEVAASQKLSIRQFYKQIEESPALGKLIEYCRTLSQAHWESLARKNVTNKGFNGPLYAFYMKNKFGWADKTETVNSNENLNTDLDSLRQNVNKQIAQYLKDYTPELTDAQRVVQQIAREQADE